MPYIVQDKIAFLSEASKILSSSLDYNVTLAIISKLIVTNVADFCIIDIFDGYKMSRLAINVSDPKKHALALKVFNFDPDPRNKDAIYAAAKQGSPIIIKKATKKWIESVSHIKEERETIIKLGLNSHMFIPLKSRGDVIGVITIASMDPKFSYSSEDAIFLEELANRAGTAVDKARLYLEAQNALRTRDEFLSIASHELKTPLTSILLNLHGMLDKIQKTKSSTTEINEIIKLIELSRKQSHRMARLINDLLNVSVVSTGRLKLEREKMDIVELVKDVVSQFKMRLSNEKVTVKIDAPVEHIYGNWDTIRLEQVISNLLSNAIKYGNKKPVTIKISLDDSNVKIQVIDQGIGIPKRDIELIFMRFKRAVSSQQFSGLGVGLYISKQIVEAHHGTLDVQSAPGQGSIFSINLPIEKK